MASPVQTPKSVVIGKDLNAHQNDVGFRGNFELDETLNREPDPRRGPTANGGNDDQEVEEGEGVEEELQEENGAHGVEVSSGTNDGVKMLITEGDVSATTGPRLNYSRRKKGKGKGKSNAKKELAIKQKFRSLLLGLKPIPFIPDKILDFCKRERLMRKLGLWDFVKVDFDRNIRADFIAQLVASYEPKSRGSYVNGFRIMVNRADLGRALKLPVKKEKGHVGGVGDVDLDWEASSEEREWLIEQFLFDWLILHEDAWPAPKEILNWLDMIKDGHPEKVDWASLIWFMVEKELTLGSELKNCYYASHLQLLIKSQREELFLVKDYTPVTVELEMESKEEEEEGDEEEKQEEGYANEEGKEEEGVDAEEVSGKDMELCAPELTFGMQEEFLARKEHTPGAVELYEDSKDDDEEEKVNDAEVNNGRDVNKEGKQDECVNVAGDIKEGEEEEKHEKVNDTEVNYGMDVNEEGKHDGWVNVDGDIKEGKEEENCLMGEPNTNLTLGQDAEEEEEEMKEMGMMYNENYNANVEEVAEEDLGQGKLLFHGKNGLGEHFMQRCDNDGGFGNFEDVKEVNDDEEGEREGGQEEDDGDDDAKQEDEEEEDVGDETVRVFPNDHSLEGNGPFGNLLQTLEGNQIAFGSQQQLHPSSSMEMQHMSSSFLNHSGKRAIEHGSDIPHYELHGSSNKRIRTNDTWDSMPMDFGTCIHQIQQMAEKARIIYEQKERDIQETSMNQRILLGEVEKRDAIINQLTEVVKRKDTEIYRLNRELHLMKSVLDGYRKALKDTQKNFDEYRKRAKLKEESVYRDAWPGGLMLSSSEIEAFRKDYEAKCLTIETQVGETEAYFVDKLGLLDGKLRGLEAEAKELFQLNMIRKKKKAEAEAVSEVDKDEPTLQVEEEASGVAEPILSSQNEAAAIEEEEEEEAPNSTAQAEDELLGASESLTNE